MSSLTRGFRAFLPCRAAVVIQDPQLRGRDHPPPPGLDRVAVAEEADPGQQALLVMAHLRKGETFAELAAGFGVGVATAWRYVNETVALLAARRPSCRRRCGTRRRPRAPGSPALSSRAECHRQARIRDASRVRSGALYPGQP
jgi:hypothetical protein